LSVAVTPLAIPILAGPGTIATAMSFASTGGISEMVITIVAFGVLCLIAYACFISGQRLVAFLGSNGLGVVTRILGLTLHDTCVAPKHENTGVMKGSPHPGPPP
jgi:multiple antibiotic resistance protein